MCNVDILKSVHPVEPDTEYILYISLLIATGSTAVKDINKLLGMFKYYQINDAKNEQEKLNQVRLSYILTHLYNADFYKIIQGGRSLSE